MEDEDDVVASPECVQATPALSVANAAVTPQSLVASIISSLEQMPREDTPQSLAVRLFTDNSDHTPAPVRASSAFCPVDPCRSHETTEESSPTQSEDKDIPLSQQVPQAIATVASIVRLMIEVRSHVTTFMKSLEEEM